MLYRPEKNSLLSKAKETAFTGAYFGLALVAMAGWIYFLGSMVWRFALWCLS